MDGWMEESESNAAVSGNNGEAKVTPAATHLDNKS